MYAYIDYQSYKLEGDKAIILKNPASIEIEIFPTITLEDKTYEVVFPDDCFNLFNNKFLKKFTLHKLLHPTNNITNTIGMFYACHRLKSLDLTNLDTSNVTNMEFMFHNCYSLKYLNISNFDISKVIELSNMLYNCRSLKSLDLSNLSTTSIMSMHHAFNNCKSLEYLNISKIVISESTEIYNIFNNCTSLKQIDASGFISIRLGYLCKKTIVANCNTNASRHKLKKRNYVNDVNCNNSYN